MEFMMSSPMRLGFPSLVERLWDESASERTSCWVTLVGSVGLVLGSVESLLSMVAFIGTVVVLQAVLVNKCRCESFAGDVQG